MYAVLLSTSSSQSSSTPLHVGLLHYTEFILDVNACRPTDIIILDYNIGLCLGQIKV